MRSLLEIMACMYQAGRRNLKQNQKTIFLGVPQMWAKMYTHQSTPGFAAFRPFGVINRVSYVSPSWQVLKSASGPRAVTFPSQR